MLLQSHHQQTKHSQVRTAEAWMELLTYLPLDDRDSFVNTTVVTYNRDPLVISCHHQYHRHSYHSYQSTEY